MALAEKSCSGFESPIDQLLELAPYAHHTPDTEELFREATAAAIRSHMQGNVQYAAYLAKKSFSPDRPFAIEDIPFLPVQLFKSIGPDLATVSRDKVRVSLSSSATSGIPSTVPIDAITAKRQTRCMSMVMADFLGKKRRPFLIMDANPNKNSGKYGARAAALRGYMNFASKSDFFMAEEAEELVFSMDRLAAAIQSLDPSIPVTLFGFTYVLFGHVLRTALASGQKLPLPEGSHVLHIGGWKKLEFEKISRREFAEAVWQVFAVPQDHLIDVYGFTEQMGLNYPDCPCGFKHVPHMSRLIVRDPASHLPLLPGQEGLLEFVSPLPHSYAGVAVLTDDIGELATGECPFGRHGQRFRIIGRARKAEIRGCGEIMGEKMRRIVSAPAAIPKKSDKLTIHAWGASPHDITDLARHAREAGKWLAQQPTELIIGLIDSVSQTWMDSPELAEWKYNGLSFLSRWCSAANLRALASQALRGIPEALDRFTPEKARKNHYLKALPVGIVGHWLSGNVPLLSLLTLVQCLVTHNSNILKTASSNFQALQTILSTFAGREYQSQDGEVIKGDDLLKAVSLLYYNHDNTSYGEILSSLVDARIAWGGRQAVDAICALPAKAEVVDLVFGPKTSFMVIARECLASEADVKKLLRRAATDVSSFDQAACSSPHTIFVEEGGAISPLEFAERLGESLERALTLIPRQDEDDALTASVQTARAVGEFKGHCWHSAGPGWTVIYDIEPGLARPVYSRTITVKPANDIMDCASLVNKDVQTIGLAATGEKRFKFADLAAAGGAMRFPEIGAMTGFDAPWDGMFVMDRLVRWVSLGGASSVIATKDNNMDRKSGNDWN